MPTQPIPPLASIAPGATSLLSISRRSVYTLIEQGELETVRIGGRRLVVGDSLAAYIERLREQAAS